MGPVTKLKILVIGESGVGKSSITQAFTRGNFDSTRIPTTIAVDYKDKVIEVNGVFAKLCIWDTAGMERYRSITPAVYRDAHGAVFVYDVSDPITLIKLNDWIEELRFYSTKENIVCLLVGNKKDKTRAIPRSKGQEFAQKHRIMFTESSVKNKEGVDLIFEELAHKIIETPSLWKTDESSNMCISSEERIKKKSSCYEFEKCFE